MKLSRMVMGSAVAVSLVGAGLMATPVAAQDDCDAIYGGDVFNETVIDLNANAGTAISDASAGSNNAATTGGGGLDALNVASAGNGGVATAAANGGAIGTGNINSGGNVGNAIAPVVILIGATAVDTPGDVARILRRSLVPAAALLLVVALLTAGTALL